MYKKDYSYVRGATYVIPLLQGDRNRVQHPRSQRHYSQGAATCLTDVFDHADIGLQGLLAQVCDMPPIG